MVEEDLKFTTQTVWGVLSNGYQVSAVVFQETHTHAHTGVPQVRQRYGRHKCTTWYWSTSLLRHTSLSTLCERSWLHVKSHFPLVTFYVDPIECDWSYLSFNRQQIQTDVICCCGCRADGFTLWLCLLHSNPGIRCLQRLRFEDHHFASTLPSLPAQFRCYSIQLMLILVTSAAGNSLASQCYQQHTKMSSLVTINLYLLYFKQIWFFSHWTFSYSAVFRSAFAIPVLPASDRCKQAAS